MNEVEDLLMFLRDLCSKAVRHAERGEHDACRAILVEMQAELVLQTDDGDC